MSRAGSTSCLGIRSFRLKSYPKDSNWFEMGFEHDSWCIGWKYAKFLNDGFFWKVLDWALLQLQDLGWTWVQKKMIRTQQYIGDYRVGQNHGMQVLRISCIKFHILQFIPHRKRDLSSLPEASEAAVKISWKKEAVGQLMRSHQGNSTFPVRFSKPAFCGFGRSYTYCWAEMTSLAINSKEPFIIPSE